jgi:isoquinoline 1-oxidoreductase alpha subunit
MIRFKANGKDVSVDVPDDVPLLWALREELNLCGPKLGCGMGVCGACTVHLDGSPIRSCITPVKAVDGHSVTTIEGLGAADSLHPLQKSWAELNVAQCGYCQSGQLMTAAALVAKTPHPTDSQITEAMSGNLCRCGTYLRIHAAIRKATTP